MVDMMKGKKKEITEPNQDNINLVSPVIAKVDFFTSYNIYGPTISAFSMTAYVLTSHF